MQNEIFETQDGSHSILSHQFGVSYHSKYGAIQESKHVFIEAALHPKLLTSEPLNILEIGFGTGLNALLSLQLAQQNKVSIRYEAVEAYPVPVEQAALLNYAEMLNAPELAPLFTRMHECEWGEDVELLPEFVLHKRLERFENLDYAPTFDIIFFDAFAPTAQPELWEHSLLEKMYKALLPGGLLTTYCAKGAVKRAMKAVGFTVETLQGPPGKREMTRGVK